MLQERFNSHTRAEIDSALIETARARLDRAEHIVNLRKSEYAALPCDAPTRGDALRLLKLSERAAFNRRLELELLLRNRRNRATR